MKKELLFKIILLLIPILFLIILEGTLRLFNYGDQLDVFISHPALPHHYLINPGLGKRYFPSKSVQPKVSVDLLLKEKPKNGYRIFAFGGSSAAGYPYYYNATFTKMLKDRLDDVFPDLRIEIINLAMPAVNSHTVLDLVKEVIPFQPDAFLIYAGHNEFYGALGSASNEQLSKQRWLVKLYLSLQRFRMFQLLQDIIQTARMKFGSPPDKEIAEQKTLMERMVGNKKIPYRSERYWETGETFRENLEEIARISKENNIELILSKLISNIKDQPPFISISKSDSLNAKLHYECAKEYELERNPEKAKKEYYKAKDLDGLRFRASEDFNNIIRQICDKYNATCVPMVKYFEEQSPNGIIGNNLLLDHLHPSVKGTFLMAKAIFKTMKDKGLISRNWHLDAIKSDSEYWFKTGVTELDRNIGNLRIKVLSAGWPFQEESHVDNLLGNYKPKTRLETIAFDYWNNKMTWQKAHLIMAKYYESVKNYLAAEIEYLALIKTRPFEPALYNNLSKVYFAQNKVIPAENTLRQSLEISATNFAYRMLGAIYIQKKDFTQGIRLLKKALELNIKDIQSMYNLAGAYASIAEYKKSEEMLNRLFKINPNHKKGLSLLEQVKRNL